MNETTLGGNMKSLNRLGVGIGIITCMFGTSGFVHAQNMQKNENEKTSADLPLAVGESQQVSKKSIKDYLGISYFLFVSGPGLADGKQDATPNQFGNADDNGLSTFNVISFKYKMSKDLAIDFQTRSEVFFNSRQAWNDGEKKMFTNGKLNNHQVFRWESPRIGISGKLASGKDWNLSGAVNTDFPYIFPEPLTGYTAKLRTVLLSPGMFANLSYTPAGSRFSLFSVLSPRFFVYGDNEAVTPEEQRGGFSWRNKPHLAINLSPTVNYQMSDKWAATIGTTFDFRKQLGSSWNAFDVSLSNNSETTAWRFMAMPVSLGATYQASQALRIYPFVQAFPIAAQRINARTGEQASLLETASLGLWVSGTIL